MFAVGVDVSNGRSRVAVLGAQRKGCHEAVRVSAHRGWLCFSGRETARIERRSSDGAVCQGCRRHGAAARP